MENKKRYEEDTKKLIMWKQNKKKEKGGKRREHSKNEPVLVLMQEGSPGTHIRGWGTRQSACTHIGQGYRKYAEPRGHAQSWGPCAMFRPLSKYVLVCLDHLKSLTCRLKLNLSES